MLFFSTLQFYKMKIKKISYFVCEIQRVVSPLLYKTKENKTLSSVKPMYDFCNNCGVNENRKGISNLYNLIFLHSNY